MLSIGEIKTYIDRDRTRRFGKRDLGIEPYLEEEVWNIQVEDEVLEIALKY